MKKSHPNEVKVKLKVPEIVSETIKISDLVLQVLDARFISETRNEELERIVKKQGKQLIYVINKIDLVNIDTLMLELSSFKLSNYFLVSCIKNKGLLKLRDKLKIEAKKISKFKRLHVCTVGYPNTGKSTLINLLTRKSSAKTGSKAGFTKGVQKIRLNKDVLILDTPGLIEESEYSTDKEKELNRQVKIGARTLDTIKEPELIVEDLMKKYSKQIESFYEVDVNADTDELLEKIGRKFGFLKKGGVVNEDSAARKIIKDWQEGKIKH